MKIVTVSSVVILGVFWFSLPAFAAPTPAPTPTPAASPVAGATPAATPSPTPDPAKLCYLQVSESTLKEHKECETLDTVKCSQAFKSCKWHNFERKCLGLVYHYCSASAPKSCEVGLIGVTAFPPKLAKSNQKFKCREANPIQMLPLKK